MKPSTVFSSLLFVFVRLQQCSG